MSKYKTMFEEHAPMPEIKDVECDLAAATTWQEAFYIGRFVFEHADTNEEDKLVMDAYEKAFSLGLSLSDNQEEYELAAQQLADIYFEFKMYDKASGMLSVIDFGERKMPDWVDLDIASAYIHTDKLSELASKPKLLFERLDAIDESNEESKRRRKFLMLEFMNCVREKLKTEALEEVDWSSILEKSDALGIKKPIEKKDAKVEELNKIIEEQEREIMRYKIAIEMIKGEALKGTEEQQDVIDEEIFDVSNFLSRNQKILIIGGSAAKEHHLRGKLKSMGFNFSKEQLEFELDYDDVKSYAARIKPWNSKYAGIIVGPCPHKAKNIEGYSSFIEMMQSEEGYPHVEEARDKAGNLKLSNESLGEAMIRMSVYLQSIK